MYITTEEFIGEWARETMLTQQLFDAMTDASLEQTVYPEGRTLGQIAWHITGNIPDYLTHFGLSIDRVSNADVVPDSAEEISRIFSMVKEDAIRAVKEQWTEDSLKQVQNAFGREMANAQILALLIKHIVHHRGQMTVLMRQAGLQIPGMYGPTKEDWSKMGQQPPLI